MVDGIEPNLPGEIGPGRFDLVRVEVCHDQPSRVESILEKGRERAAAGPQLEQAARGREMEARLEDS